MGKKTTVGNETEDHYTELVAAVAPARVSAQLSVTHNLGDYNSVHIGFKFEDNVPDDKTLEEVANELYRKAEATVSEMLSEYTNG